MDERTKEVLETLLIYLENHEKPCVLDADALNNIAGMEQKKEGNVAFRCGEPLDFSLLM